MAASTLPLGADRAPSCGGSRPSPHRGPGRGPALSLRAPRGVNALAAGGEALARRASAGGDALEALAQEYATDGPMIDRALAAVRAFIVERGRIVYGGLAIDFALRLRGERLYPDGKRPDYDFMSPDSVGDAYDLAERLAAAGFPEVNAIRGMHVQTMRVRVDVVVVADIGYAPRAVFDGVPTLVWESVRIVHPDFQRMDQHLAFCFPFNGAPREDVFHRWKKDLARWNLLNAAYPLPRRGRGRGLGLGLAPALASAPRVTGTSRVDLVGPGHSLVAALHGFAAYAALRRALDDARAAVAALPQPEAGGPEPAGDELAAPRLALDFLDKRRVAVELPAGDAVALASPYPADVAGAGAVVRAPWMDAQPRTFQAGSTVVFSTRNRLLSVFAVRAGPGPDDQCLVVSPQYLLLWLLCEAHRADEPARSVYRDYYGHTLDVLRSAEALYTELARREAGTPRAEAVQTSWLTSPFVPSLRTLGRINQDSAYQVSMALNAAALAEPVPPALEIPEESVVRPEHVPRNYYPRPGKARPDVSYASPIFLRDGSVVAGPGAPA